MTGMWAPPARLAGDGPAGRRRRGPGPAPPGLQDGGDSVGGRAAGWRGRRTIPFIYILILPARFAAGMSLVDATDGILMLGAYGWAYIKPIRKLYYNLNIKLVSVLIAFLIGGVEALSMLSEKLGWQGGIWDVIADLDFGLIGFGIIAIFLASWAVSTAIYRWKG